jgi:hypothetical protein
MLTDKDINIRKPVWSALSDLWLDTELQEWHLKSIAETLFESGYSLDVLRDIYEKEVAPVVYTNLLCIAGEWAGFNDKWLHEEIISSLKSRGKFGQLFLKLRRNAMFYATKEHWKDLEAQVKEMKHQAS